MGAELFIHAFLKMTFISSTELHYHSNNAEQDDWNNMSVLRIKGSKIK